MVQRVWSNHLKLQASTLCSVFLVAQFFLPTIQFLIQRSDTFLFATNKEPVTLQLDMPKFLVALECVLQPLVQGLQI
jgi:hypothetical protein